MDDADVLVQWLYARPKFDRTKVDAAFEDYQLLKRRGDKTTFAKVLARRGLMDEREAEKVVRAERAAIDEQSTVKDEPPPEPKPPKSRAPEKPRREARDEKSDGRRREARDEKSDGRRDAPDEKSDGKRARGDTRSRPRDAAPAASSAPSKPAKKDAPKAKLDVRAIAFQAGVVGIVVVVGVMAVMFIGRMKTSGPPPGPEVVKSNQSAGTKALESLLEDARKLEESGRFDDAIRIVEQQTDSASPAQQEVLRGERDRLAKAARTIKEANALVISAQSLVDQGKVEEAAKKLDDFAAEHEGDQSKPVQDAVRAIRDGKMGDIIVAAANAKGDDDGPASGPNGPKSGGDDISVTGGGKKSGGSGGKRPASSGGGSGEGDLVVGDPDDKDPKKGDGRRPTSDGGSGGGNIVVDAGEKKPEKKGSGARPVRGDSGDGRLGVVLGDDDEDEGAKKDEPEPDDDKAEPKVEPLPLKTPLEVEPLRADLLTLRRNRQKELLARTERWLSAARARRDGAFEAEAKRAKAASEAKPLTVDLPGPIHLSRAVVDRYDKSGFHLQADEGEAGFAWDTPRQELALKVRALAVRADVAEDQYRFGRWLAARRKLPEAKEAFRKAVALDATYEKRVPELKRLEMARAAFAGEVQRTSDGRVRIIYPWQRKEELDDWSPLEGSIANVDHGRLLVQKGRVVGKQDIHFTSDLAIEAKLPFTIEGEPGIGFIAQTPRGFVGWELIYDSREGACALIDVLGGKVLFGPAKASKGCRELKLEVRGGDVIAVVGGATRARVPAHSLDALRPFVTSRGGSTAFESVAVSGRVSRDWLRKTYAGADELLQELLQEDALGAPREAWDRPAEPVSAEDPESTKTMDEKALRRYVEAKDRLDKPDVPSVMKALVDITKCAVRAPKAAAPYYQRARIAERLGKLGPALHDLNRAVERAGGFHEALAERALVLARLERLDDAQKDVDKALEWGPANARAHFVKGFIHFRKFELDKALEECELSYALVPKNEDEIAGFIRSVTHVIQGPAWERSFKKQSRHYDVLTDLSQEACDRYANELEAVRPVYARMLDMTVSPEVDARHSRVMIFDSRLGYLAYSLGAEGQWLDSALGYYSPSFRQLLLYEDLKDKNGEDTLDTLFHEGFHQWADGVLVGLPTWADEGLAEYFATLRIEPDGTVKGLGRIQTGRLQNLRWWLREKKRFWPFDEIMNMSHEKFMAEDAAFKYAQAWSMAHYLVEGENGKHKKLLKKYLLLLKSGRTGANAYNRTFGRLDMDALEKGWLAHVEAMPKVEEE